MAFSEGRLNRCSAINLEKIIMKDGYSQSRNDAYCEGVVQKIIAVVSEAQSNGLVLGGAIMVRLNCLRRFEKDNLFVILMKTSNVEVKAAAMCIFGYKKVLAYLLSLN